LVLGTIESDDGLSRAYAVAPVIGLDGKVHGANANIDVLGYTSPELAPGLTAGFSYVDIGTASTGLGAGTTGASVAQTSVTGNFQYKAGPIDARIDATTWGCRGDAAVTSNTTQSRFRVSGNYDLGVAKIGLGYSSLKRTTGTTNKNTTIGVSAPLGATTVGLVYEKNVNKGVTTTGTTLGVQYNLSKRTNISAGYAQWKADGATTNSTFRVLVGHGF
jgi:predicted porin